jgi:nucleotide-binding universal stress UspA family protein
MLGIKHILFPIDFSERCCGAVPFVDAMARQYGAKVTLLSVTDGARMPALSEPGGPVVVNWELELEDLQGKLDGAMTREFAGLQVDRVAGLGDAATYITEFADCKGVDLIMMPTRGYGVFRRFLLGSVTAKILHDARQPVWTATHMADPRFTGFLPYRSILCAVDCEPGSRELIQWAGDFASDAGAKLRLVHVLPGMSDFPSPEYQDELREQALTKLEQLQEGLGFHAPASVVFGQVVGGVCDEASRRVADLLIIGRGAIHEKLGRLRTHAYGMIRESPCPVLSV